jgi:trans-aconitate methyltransferase
VVTFDSPQGSTPREYFDEMYRRHRDPWSFETRWYEQRKRALTMAVLPEPRFASALEIGCSIGLLTETLADRCESLVAVDLVPSAVEAAGARVASKPHVEVFQHDIAGGLPRGSFELVVLSEVGYYFEADALRVLLQRIAGALSDTGTFVACHWRHPVEEYPLSGDQVHALMRAQPGWTTVSLVTEDDFLLEVFGADPRSVAQRTGML